MIKRVLRKLGLLLLSLSNSGVSTPDEDNIVVVRKTFKVSRNDPARIHEIRYKQAYEDILRNVKQYIGIVSNYEGDVKEVTMTLKIKRPDSLKKMAGNR